MPLVYLSPSTQEFNYFINGGSEEEWMNIICDQIEPYLIASNIPFIRNSPSKTAGDAIIESNNSGASLHVAIHSNSSPSSLSGILQGTDIYYSPISRNGKRMALITQKNFRKIYPDKMKVNILTTDFLGEVTKTKAPAILIEIAYHDNIDDANWIKENTQIIAKAIAMSICEYFNVPFVDI